MSDHEVKQIKCELLNQIIWIGEQGEEIWDRLVGEQQSCSSIIAQQVLVNDKFSEFHDLWMQKSVPDDIGTFHRFNEIDEEVTALANMLEEFEPRTLQASQTMQELSQEFSANRKYMDETREYVMECMDLNHLESVEFEDFRWIDTDLIPNIEEFEDEWTDMDLYPRICSLVDQMRELIEEPDNAGEYYSSSSSSTEALGVNDDNYY